MSGTDGMIEKVKGVVESALKDAETQFKTLVKEQSDVATEQAEATKKEIDELKTALKSIEEHYNDKKSFGMPGLIEELDNRKKKGIDFSLANVFLAQYLLAAGGKTPNTPMVHGVEDAWKTANKITGSDGFETEICKEYSNQRASITEKSLDVLKGAKGYESDDGSQGGFLVPPEVTNEIIDLVIAQMPLLNMPGIMRINNLHGDLFIPSIAERNTAYHVGETIAPTESTGKITGKFLRAKKIGAFTKASNRLLYQTRGAAETIIRRLLSESMAFEWHRGLLDGKGSESEAKGLLRYSDEMTTTYLGNTLTANNARFKIDTAQQMQQALDNVNELRDTNSYGYLMHPQAKWGMLRQKIAQYSGQSLKDGAPLDAINILLTKDKLDGLVGPIRTTTQIPVDGNNLTSAVYGDWSLFWAATFRDSIFRVSDQAADGSGGSAFLQDQLYMVMFQEYDCQVMRPAAFAYVGDIATRESAWTS